MKSQKPRILIQKNGIDMAFSHQKLNIAMNNYIVQKREEGIRVSKTDLRQNLADHLNLSPEAIKNYVHGYNGPMDVVAVQKMGEFLGVEWIELMKEVSPMTEKKIIDIENSIELEKEAKTTSSSSKEYFVGEYDQITARNAVVSVYHAMQNFVSYFGGEFDVPLNMKDEGVNDIIAAYHYCWQVMHHNMLDIPENTYRTLCAFLKELKYWIYGLPGAEYDEFGIMTEEPSEYNLTYFGQLKMAGLLGEEDDVDPFEWAEYVTGLLIDTFYSEIAVILNAYRPQEPYHKRLTN